MYLCMMGGTPLWAGVIYVDAAATGANDGSSWRNAYGSLQDALVAGAATQKPVEIRVAKGVYKPDQGAGIIPGDQTAAFHMLNDVTLKGGYAGTAAQDPNARDVSLYETVLSGDLKGDGSKLTTTRDNSCFVVTVASVDESAVIDGFTITGGGSDRIRCSDKYGGAGMVIDGGSPDLRACHFVANSTVSLSVYNDAHPHLAGCVFDTKEGMLSQASAPVLVDCVFTEASMSNNGSDSASLTRCIFDRSMLSGGHDSRLTAADCTFKSGRGFTLYVTDCNCVLTGCLFEPGKDEEVPNIVVSSSATNLTLEDCRFVGNKRTCIMSDERANLYLTRCSFVANTGSFMSPVWSVGSLILDDCEFIGNSAPWDAGAVHAAGSLLKATHCIFAGNSSIGGTMFAPGAVMCHPAMTQLSHCTFVGNRGQPSAIECMGSRAELTNCIVWNGPDPFSRFPSYQSKTSVTYSDIQGGYAGEGNIGVDPCFVDPGHWADPNDPNVELDADNPKAVWMNGDYHLKSQAGRWDRATEIWVYDEVTSACIDAGDPNTGVGDEPVPNGGIVNLGAYGGTAEASKSYFIRPTGKTRI